VLHPVFDMNLPEGALAERLRKEFSKVIPHFDALALLQVVGQSQIGRLRARPGEAAPEVPTENLTDLLAHDGAEGLFDSLLARYAVHSGISGAMPKVLVRDSAALSRLSHRGATHRQSLDGRLPPPGRERILLHAGGPACGAGSADLCAIQRRPILLVERFDLRDGVYLGFEDFCVLNGKTASQKYDGSYEGVTRRIRDFVSPEQVRPALAQFSALALSCALKNGDAHLKKFWGAV
jgi:serine/threonine-protein kinase HipA